MRRLNYLLMSLLFLLSQVQVKASYVFELQADANDHWTQKFGGQQFTLPNGKDRWLKPGEQLVVPAGAHSTCLVEIWIESFWLRTPVRPKHRLSIKLKPHNAAKPEAAMALTVIPLMQRRKQHLPTGKDLQIVLVGIQLAHRSFNGANKALPVLASSLTRAGFKQVLQRDLERPDLSLSDLLQDIDTADLVLLAGCMTPQWPEIDTTVQAIHARLLSLGRDHVPIIVGGYATKGAADILRESPWIAAFFDGEGEEGVVEIAQAVASGTFDQARPTIKGLCFIDAFGTYHGSIAERIQNLDPYDQNFGLIHIPEIHDMDIFRAAGGRQLQCGQIYDQRGCPFVCGYCNKSQENNRVASLSAEAFRQQLEQLKCQGIEAVYLDVDTATINRQRFLNHAQVLKEVGLIWGTNTRIDKIDFALMERAVACGCTYMFFGVEHTSANVGLAIGKFNGSLQSQIQQARAYPAQVRQVFADMRRAGLPSSYFIILGLPYAILDESETVITGYRATTFEEDMAAIEFGLEHCQPDYLNFNMLRFMPGSVAADAPLHPAFSCIRPSGARPITGGYFLPRVAAKLGYPVPQNHGVYRLCESVGHNQPTTTAVNAERIYTTVAQTMAMINSRIDRGELPTTLFVDREVTRLGLVGQDDDGRYFIASLKEFEDL